MDLSPTAKRKLAGGARTRIAELLRGYPDVSAAEEAEILRFLKKGSFLDVGLMTADESLRPRLDRFRADHSKDFALGWKEYLLVLLIAAALVAILASLWDWGLR